MTEESDFLSKQVRLSVFKANELLIPIEAIVRIANSLRDEYSLKKDDELLKLVEMLNEASYKMSHTLRGVLLTNSIENLNYNYDLLKRNVNILDKLKGIINRLAIYYRREKDIALVEEKVLSILKINEDHFSFLVEELLGYSFKTSIKGKTIIVSITSSDDNEIELTITNFGIRSGNVEHQSLGGNAYYNHNIDLNNFPFYETCRKIVELHNGSLIFLDKPISGHVIQLKIKGIS